MPPKASALAATNDSTASRCVTSTAMPKALTPCARISASVFSRVSLPRAQIATAAPSSANVSAVDRPIPRLPPVTTATFPAKPRSMGVWSFLQLLQVRAESKASIRTHPAPNQIRSRNLKSLRPPWTPAFAGVTDWAPVSRLVGYQPAGNKPPRYGLPSVILAQAGIHLLCDHLDSGFRRSDGLGACDRLLGCQPAGDKPPRYGDSIVADFSAWGCRAVPPRKPP